MITFRYTFTYPSGVSATIAGRYKTHNDSPVDRSQVIEIVPGYGKVVKVMRPYSTDIIRTVTIFVDGTTWDQLNENLKNWILATASTGTLTVDSDTGFFGTVYNAYLENIYYDIISPTLAVATITFTCVQGT